MATKSKKRSPPRCKWCAARLEGPMRRELFCCTACYQSLASALPAETERRTGRPLPAQTTQPKPEKKLRDRVCRKCGEIIVNNPDSPSQRHVYCSRECSLDHFEREPGVGPVRADKGSWAELVVAVDLMRRGIKMYRALSVSSPCDMIGIKPTGELVRVEVASGVRKKGGGYSYPPHEGRKYDLLAVVFADASVAYDPEL